MRWCLSLAPMTDRLDVVAVRIAHEGSEVARVVLGPQAWLVKYLSTVGASGIEERSDRRAIGCGERDMRLAQALPCDLVANPELEATTKSRQSDPAVAAGLADVDRGQLGAGAVPRRRVPRRLTPF